MTEREAIAELADVLRVVASAVPRSAFLMRAQADRCDAVINAMLVERSEEETP